MKFLRWLLLLLVCVSSYAQQGENKVALVIGNSTYRAAPLKNPANDSRDVAARLRGLGFTVIERSNLTVKQIGGTLREFRSKLTPGSVALFFYAGHGLQIKGENYLPAVDADISSEEDVPTQSLATKQIMDVLGDAKTRLNLVFLDACRDNPYARGFRSASRGLSKESAPSGTLISFATRPGGVASDGDGRNGLYTSVLLQAMNSTNLPIEQLLKKVVSGVKVASSSKQEPWMEGSIEGDFCFGPCNAVQTAVSDDRALWESVKDSKDVGELRAYLNKFPNGLFSEVASSRIRVMQTASADQKNSVKTEQDKKPTEKSGTFGYLRVAIDSTYEPFTFKTANGQPTGFDVDIANALCEQIKRKCVFVEQVWDGMIPGLNAKKYDVIISSMSITDDRMKEVDFTDKYYNTPSRIVLKKIVKYTDPASIKGKKIGVLEGSTQEAYAIGKLKPAGAIVKSYLSSYEVYLEMKSGRLDGTVADYLEAVGEFLSKPEGDNFTLAGPNLNEPKYFGYGAGIALRKGEDALKGELNAAIQAIRKNGVYKTLNDKYFAKFNIDVYGD